MIMERCNFSAPIRHGLPAPDPNWRRSAVVNDNQTEEEYMRAFGIAVASTLIAFAYPSPAAADEGQHKTVAGAGLAAIGEYFESHPEMMIDFTAVSGEYCINTWKAGGSHMSHYAVDPASTEEDVIDFVKADSMSKMGVAVEKLPRFPGQLGAMEPGTWYYLPAGQLEPHHGIKFPVALMMRASNIE